MIRLIATDLDDTLLNEKSDINPRVFEALHSAMDLGCGIVLSSGRMLEAMLPLANRIGVNAPMLLYNGALAYDHNSDQVIFADQIPYETALAIGRAIEDMGYYYQAYPGRNYYCPEVIEMTRFYAHYIHVDAIPVHEPLSHWMEKHPSGMQKFLLMDTVEGADRAQAVLREAFGDKAGFMKSKPNYVEITPPGVNKGKALIRLAAHLGLAREEVMAFGDGQNDVTMIEMAGTGVCMANGCVEARAVADRIAPTNVEDGVAVVIEDLLKRGEIGACYDSRGI